jgi:hypothetical protein
MNIPTQAKTGLKWAPIKRDMGTRHRHPAKAEKRARAIVKAAFK